MMSAFGLSKGNEAVDGCLGSDSPGWGAESVDVDIIRGLLGAKKLYADEGEDSSSTASWLVYIPCVNRCSTFVHVCHKDKKSSGRNGTKGCEHIS